MFYAVCLNCGRSYEYGGHLDSWCPACWVKTTIYCPKCNKYFDTKPAKACPNCGEAFVKPAAKPDQKVQG